VHPTGAECQADVDLEAREEELGTSRAPGGSALRTSTSPADSRRDRRRRGRRRALLPLRLAPSRESQYSHQVIRVFGFISINTYTFRKIPTHVRTRLSGDDPHRYRCRAAGGINALMFVCLCTGATRHVVADVVAGGASTSKEVAEACGAGADCGRCRRTVRAIIAAAAQVNAGAAC